MPDATTKPKRAAWPKNVPVATAELDLALKLLSLPRQLGVHPQTGKPVEASVGPFGPYVKHDGAFKSIPKTDSVYDIALDRAVELLAAPKAARTPAGKQLGMHPEDQKPVTVLSGRYGPYVKHGRVNATIPRNYEPDSLSLEQALEILAAKAARERTSAKPAKGRRAGNGERKTTTPKSRPQKKSQSRASTSPARAAAAARRKSR
jgi:DNA topoisomerase-1